MTKWFILFSLLTTQTKLLGQDLQLISLTKSFEFKTVERRTIKKASKFYKSIHSEFPKDAKFIIAPTINITVEQEDKEPKRSEQFSFKFTGSKVAPFIIVAEPNDKYHSIIDIVNKEIYYQPNSNVATNEPLPTDNISLKFQKYSQTLNLINNNKATIKQTMSL
jgi:hypothetical protein